MIDFVSTDDNVDEDTRGCAHLLAAVIALAFTDLCSTPTKQELERECNIDRKATAALRFFFNPNSVFPAYARLIGLDPKSFMVALEKRTYEHNYNKNTKNPYIPYKYVKALQIRIKWWKTDPRLLQIDLPI
jgi:hypothetical protein